MKSPEFIDTDLESSLSSGTKIPSTTLSKMSASSASPRVEIDARVEQARQQMLELRRQQDELERQRQDLEELRRRQEDFEAGKTEMLEALSRTVTMIEHEEFELNKKSTLLTNFREVYQDYVRQLQDIREVEWSPDDLKAQLAKAFSVVETARAEVNKGRAQLEFLGEGPVRTMENSAAMPVINVSSPQTVPFDFKEEMMRGFARYLPLIILGVIALIMFASNS